MFAQKHPRSQLTAIGLVAWSFLGVSACAHEFDSQMTLSGYRVIGIEASSPEVSPEGVVELKVHEFYQGDKPITYDWSVCLFSLGAGDSYACADKEFEYSLGGEESLVWDLGSEAFGLRDKLDALPPLPNADGTIRSLAQGFDIWVKLRSGPDCSTCDAIETVKRLTVSEREENMTNQNPVIDEFEVVGSLRAGETVTLRAATDAPEAYAHSVTQQPVEEEYLYTWYSSAGAAAPTRTFGQPQETELTLPDNSGAIVVMLAVRDGRGGLAVAEQTLEVR